MFDAVLWRARLNEAAALLESERRLLVAGAISDLARLEARRVEVADRLEGVPDDLVEELRPAFAAVRAAARRNARLLTAYLDGMGEAGARLRAIEQSAAEIGAYRSDGSRLDIDVARTLSTKA